MRNINKKQNLVEQARINLDKEKLSHQITLCKVEKLERIIKEVREILNQDKVSASFNTAERIALEILDKEKK